MLARTTRETLAETRAATARNSVANYSSMERLALNLPAEYQIRLIRAMQRELEWSDSAYDIAVACDAIERELIEQNHRANGYEGRAA